MVNTILSSTSSFVKVAVVVPELMQCLMLNKVTLTEVYSSFHTEILQYHCHKGSHLHRLCLFTLSKAVVALAAAVCHFMLHAGIAEPKEALQYTS